MGKRARLFVISGPAGVGKGTLVKRVRELDPSLALTVSATTREPRPQETDGVSYHFISEERFAHLIAEGAFLEWAQVHNHRYGTLRSEVDRRLEKGTSVILEIDVQGGACVRKIYPDVVLIFVLPPSWEELEARLRGRGTESPESLALRLANAKREMALADTYDVRIVNDDLETATNELLEVLERYTKEEGI